MPESDHPFASAKRLAVEWPCPACGAAEPCRETGHDPCIRNLPGVIFACCGHGRTDGYVMFDDGRVLRGLFENTPHGVGRWTEYLEPPYVLADLFEMVRAMWGRRRAERIKLTFHGEPRG